jgi:hypothetical protein
MKHCDILTMMATNYELESKLILKEDFQKVS